MKLNFNEEKYPAIWFYTFNNSCQIIFQKFITFIYFKVANCNVQLKTKMFTKFSQKISEF